MCDQQLQVFICWESSTDSALYSAKKRFISKINFQGTVVSEKTYYLESMGLEPE